MSTLLNAPLHAGAEPSGLLWLVHLAEQAMPHLLLAPIILPLLTAALDSGEKQPAPPMVKMKRPTPPKPTPIGDTYVCGGCGYEYVPELGDEDGEIAPGTLFEQLPADWVCPECAEGKDQFVKA